MGTNSLLKGRGRPQTEGHCATLTLHNKESIAFLKVAYLIIPLTVVQSRLELARL